LRLKGDTIYLKKRLNHNINNQPAQTVDCQINDQATSTGSSPNFKAPMAGHLTAGFGSKKKLSNHQF